MALADPAQREDEADRAGLEPGLIPMADDAGVEQRRRLERIFLAEDAADQQLPILAELRTLRHIFLHLVELA